MDEPDEVIFEARGRPCRLLRNRRTGTWCGYVGVAHDHWAAIPDFNLLNRYLDHKSTSRSLYPHGGLTYSSPLLVNASTEVPPNVWWLGFDAAHGGDLIPMIDKIAPTEGADRDVYRTQAYMMDECARLAEAVTTLDGYGGPDE